LRATLDLVRVGNDRKLGGAVPRERFLRAWRFLHRRRADDPHDPPARV